MSTKLSDMKKQFQKIKVAAENLSRSNRTENKNDELLKVDKQVEKYKDVLEKIHKKFTPSSAGSEQDKEKRIKKVHEFRLGQSLEESSKELPNDLILYDVLIKCGDLEKTIANYIVENEIQTENELTKKLKNILDTDIQDISTHKRTVQRYLNEYNSIKKSHENAQRSNENPVKINQLKLDQEECELKLEKERDCWAAQMFELIAKDEIIAYSIRDYVRNQKNYYEKSIRHMENVLFEIDKVVNTCQKKRVFGVSLQEHLNSTSRSISSVIELCCCCLIERGLLEEGLLRVGCAGTKLKRMKNAIDAQYVSAPLSTEYQDIHVIASILKLYLRELPEPLLTYNLYQEFITGAQRTTELERKNSIKIAINNLPKENYNNLKYLIKFLWCLCQREEQNKMSAQNIAIVMSPNILWPPETTANSQNYECQVNSSSAVNIIVALLINECDYFFDNDKEFDFYITLNKDGLFVDNQANNHNNNNCGNGDYSGQILNESIISQQQLQGLQLQQQLLIQQQQQQQQQEQLTVKEQKVINQTHSRSNSNDTSRIFLGTIDNSAIENVGRSHSNDSLSDTSPSYTGSPKLPARRKHNKPSAPTPPHTITNHKMSASLISSSIGYNDTNHHYQQQNINNNYQLKHLNYEQSPPTGSSSHKSLDFPQKCDGTSQTPPLILSANVAAGSTNEKNKPDKPPRPSGPIECHTLNRSTYKNRSIEKVPPKPTALPRTILNITKSTENLSISNDDTMSNSTVMLRDKPEIREKPIIPERPVTLMRPTSFRTDNQFQQDIFKEHNNTETTKISPALNNITENRNINGNDYNTSGGGNGKTSSIKKASSFRMMNSSGSPSNAQNIYSGGNGSSKIINSNLANSTSSLCSNNSLTNNTIQSAAALASSTHNHKTKLERAQFFNVDKKQVAIIDFVTTAATVEPTAPNLITTTRTTNPPTKLFDHSALSSATETAITSTKDFISKESSSDAVGDTSSNSTRGGQTKSTITPTNQVPISPRGFNQNIKRPQVPAPAPPTNRRKSDGTLGDSTHL